MLRFGSVLVLRLVVGADVRFKARMDYSYTRVYSNMLMC